MNGWLYLSLALTFPGAVGVSIEAGFRLGQLESEAVAFRRYRGKVRSAAAAAAKRKLEAEGGRPRISAVHYVPTARERNALDNLEEGKPFN